MDGPTQARRSSGIGCPLGNETALVIRGQGQRAMALLLMVRPDTGV